MSLLVIDTCANLCAVCVYDREKGRVVAERSDDIGRGHAEHLMDVVASVMDEAGTDFADIAKIGVTVGPGSFTGIRVGVAAARGFAVARNVPVAGVGTLEAIAAHAVETGAVTGPFAVTVHGGRGQVSCQRFDRNSNPDGAPFQTAMEAMGARLAGEELSTLVGDAAAEIAAETGHAHALPVAVGPIATIARLAAVSERPATPLYLRAADAKPQTGTALPRRQPQAAR